MEEWRDVDDFPGYRVSSMGNVIGPKGGILKPQPTRDGYHRVNLYKFRKMHHVSVHRLVCHAFNGPCSDGLVTNHINNIRSDNRPENLEWVTHKQNTQHRRVCGTYANGGNNSRAKLTQKQVDEIRALRSQGETYKNIASLYNVRQSTIGWILTGGTWKEAA